MLLTTEDAAYIAGIIDGEGTISLDLSFPKRGGYQFHARLCVTNSSQLLLDYLTEKLGGAIYRKKGEWETKPCYRWHICSKDEVSSLLKIVLPFLVVKKRHAEIVVDFIDNFIPLQSKSDEVKEKEIERRLNLVTEIQSLKYKKGA